MKNQNKHYQIKLLMLTLILAIGFLFSSCQEKETEAQGAEGTHKTQVEKETHEHTAGEWAVSLEPTCENGGERVKKCTVCEVVLETASIPTIECVAGEWVILTKADCENEGLRHRNCTMCHKELERETIETHNRVTQAAVAPSCIAKGLTEGCYCRDCGEVLVAQSELPMVEHTWVTDPATESTCQYQGKTEGSHCASCLTVRVTQQSLPLKEHIVTTDPRIEPTCTTAGKTKGTHCKVCRKVFTEQKTIAALGHSFDAVTGDCANCSSTAYVKYTSLDTFLKDYQNQSAFIIDLRYMAFESGKQYTVTLNNKHTYVRVIGDENKIYEQITFEIGERYGALSMDFVNANLKNKNSVIKCESTIPLSIGFYGNRCSLVCTDADDARSFNALFYPHVDTPEDGQCPIDVGASSLNILCAANSVTVKGANGGDGTASPTDASDGSDGAYAVYADVIKVDLAQGYAQSNIVFEAGVGGAGGDIWLENEDLSVKDGANGKTPESATNVPVVYRTAN